MVGPRIAMLGLGAMNSAILDGILNSATEPSDVVGTTRTPETANQKADEFKIEVIPEQVEGEANSRVAGGSDVVFLGVLPHQVTGLCSEIAGALKKHTLVVSVAAGVTIEMLESTLPKGQPVLRAMPNTPVGVGNGVVGITPGLSVSTAHIRQVKSLLEDTGVVHVIEENQMDALGAITGSGPGYLYYLAEHMTAAGVGMGFDPETASQLVARTLQGASQILIDRLSARTADAATLRADMCIPGGTTERAIKLFDKYSMGEAIQTGVKGSAERSAEITEQLAN